MPVITSIPFCEEMPSQFKLGETSAEIPLNNAEENRNAAISLASQAKYGINIFTQDLDNSVFDNEEFEQHISNLARRHPRTQVRILVQDSSTAIKKGHCLIRIAQKLISAVFIQNPPEIHKDDKSAFMTVDGVGLLYRRHAENHNYQASVNFMSPSRAQKLDKFFNEAWERSTRDQKIRRLHI